MIQATESACGYTLVNLDPSTIYEIRIAPIVNDKRFSWSLPECVMTLAQPDRDILVNSERQVQNSAHDLREVLMARRTKN